MGHDMPFRNRACTQGICRSTDYRGSSKNLKNDRRNDLYVNAFDRKDKIHKSNKKFSFLKRRKFWIRFFGFAISVPILLFSILILIVYINQDEIIQAEIDALNKGHKGKITIGDTHLEPFENFPYISIRVDEVRILESKLPNAEEILSVADINLSFNLWDIVWGDYDIQGLLVEEGDFNIILHKDGTTNIQNALATAEDGEIEEPMDIHLKEIILKNLDIHKLDETTNVDVETFIHSARGGFKTDKELIHAHVDTDFELNLIDNGDTTYINDKHFEVHTDLSYNENSGSLAYNHLAYAWSTEISILREQLTWKMMSLWILISMEQNPILICSSRSLPRI